MILNIVKKGCWLSLLIFSTLHSFPQCCGSSSADQWVDSVFKSLTDEQKIAQLMIVRLSAIDPDTKKIVFYNKEVEELVRKYNIGGVCLFQGGPVTLAGFINYFQSISQTPILMSIDAENGVGMRLDSVMSLPRQMMLGALQDPDLVYQFGRLVGDQCKRMGIQVNYAPVADINNNPDNPVINDRSFGENKYRVAAAAVQYMKGLQDAGVMACAKHFPGHGDVSVDSHVDLPVIAKSMKDLDSLELYPFTELIKNGVGSVMMGHLYVPAIDHTPNLPTSLSHEAVSRLLKKQLKFRGLVFTDALEMKGVAKYFPGADASLQSLLAGNDMLCLPADVPGSIEKIMDAIHHHKLKWKDLNARVKKVLLAKYTYGLAWWRPVELGHLADDLNREITDMYKRISENALTLLHRSAGGIYPLRPAGKKIAYVGIGLNGDNEFASRMRKDLRAHVYYFDYSLDSTKATALLELLRNRYDAIVIGIHNYNRFPAGNFGISNPAIFLAKQLQQSGKTMTLVFGNPYAIKNFCDAPELAACYDDNEVTQDVAADWLSGDFTAKGKLPVSVCPGLHAGDGIVQLSRALPSVSPASEGFQASRLLAIDSVCKEAILRQAAPGCVVLVARNGRVVYEKAFGYFTYDKTERVYPESLYDLASVTKICATTMAVMKLYDEGKLDLQKTLGDYLPWTRGSDKAPLKIWDILLHQAGLKDFIPFFKETIAPTKDGTPLPGFYATRPDSIYRIRVAENMYMRADWRDTMYRRILQSSLGPRGRYVYSDNDFIFMGKIVEALSGKTLDEYVKETFYDPLGMTTTGFKPRDRFPLDRIVPTENEPIFRKQLLQGDVHDPGAAMFGGVSGHAGLFSDAYDLAVLEQLLLNGGTMNGKQYLKKETIDYFSAYHSDSSRRGLGFDKPEKDNLTRKEPYPCLSATPATFGHTGFTGTCVWVDPRYNLIYIFLSNRVNPMGGDNMRLSTLSIRGSIMQAIYHAMGVDGPPAP
ncbi:MAG TPA: glycoside hydrolase family 3 N-terminal domain-containing protein [Puia sp.]|nr:glycoside hydrolase family 3 N-terminal domain-containing protein [Puia sp.]